MLKEPLNRVGVFVLPSTASWTAAAYLPFGGWNECPEPAVQIWYPSLCRLANLLFNLERQKGAPLTESEVLDARNKAVVIALPRAVADELAEKRGYADIDPQNCWAEWLLLRESLSSEE